MPSVAEEMRQIRREAYLLGLYAARIKCIDDDGFHRSAAAIQREIDHEITRVQQGGEVPG